MIRTRSPRWQCDTKTTGAVADRDLPLLSAGVIWIAKSQRQQIKEDGRRLIKSYGVLLDVSACFRRVPLIDHAFSLMQPSSNTSSRLAGAKGPMKAV